ncbi:hypothetical protein ACFFQF_33860 [Haladaptatus pallidirubidus]|uniref:hypothetical protein n=1 Tax=Haladaptatus pallidirubidus TaxID=1008152 RepID=UPI0035EF4AEE
MSSIPPTAATVLPAVATSQSWPNSANVAIDDTPKHRRTCSTEQSNTQRTSPPSTS